jgi:outer membrane protein assembly factor BamB
VPLGYVATAPIERDGVVYSLSSLGVLSAVRASDGEVLWTFSALPGFYAFADPSPNGGTVYVAGMDGSVTALGGR